MRSVASGTGREIGPRLSLRAAHWPHALADPPRSAASHHLVRRDWPAACLPPIPAARARSGRAYPPRAARSGAGRSQLRPPAPGAPVDARIAWPLVVWTDYRNASAHGDIYAYDLTTQQEIPVVVQDGQQGKPAVSGRVVVWQDDSPQGA